MIYVNRDACDEHGQPIKPKDSWFTRADRWTKTAISEGGRHEASSSVYSDADVRVSLEELFSGKCAYCEKDIRDTSFDVEHFRPHGAVRECANHPGYYWLAYDWENLYPSCPQCNQLRKEQPTWEDRSVGHARGKSSSFPLWDESTRAMMPGHDIHNEHTLLINPCWDTPGWYLQFDATGDVVALNGNPYGEQTILTCHLSRRRLKNKRRLRMEALIMLLRQKKMLENNGNTAARRALEANISCFFLEDSCEFAGMARDIVSDPDRFGV